MPYTDAQRVVQVRYNQTEKGKAKQRRYDQSEKGKVKSQRYEQAEEGKAVRRCYNQTEEGKAVRYRYAISVKGKDAQRRYFQTDAGKAVQMRARAKRAGIPGVEELIEFYKTRSPCIKCGDPGEQVDHICALCLGGTHHRVNLQWLCIPRHREKTTNDIQTLNRQAKAQAGVLRQADPTIGLG